MTPVTMEAPVSQEGTGLHVCAPMATLAPSVSMVRRLLTPSLPRALILPKLGYPLISIYSNRESLGNPREFPNIIKKCYIMQGAIPRILIM